MADPQHPTLAQIFDRSGELLEPGWKVWWTTESDSQKYEVSFQKGPCRTSRVRTHREIALPLEKAINLWRPEVFLTAQRLAQHEHIESSDIEELVCPGEATGWVRVQLSPAARQCAEFICTIISARGALQRMMQGREPAGQIKTDVVKVSMAMRRDYPNAGECSVAFAPIDPTTRELVEDAAFHKATLVVLAPTADPERCTVTTLRHLPRIPAVTLPSVAPLFSRMSYRADVLAGSAPKADLELHQAFEDLPQFEDLYTVLSIRKCPRGGPLWPLRVPGKDELEWEAPPNKLHFSIYLGAFLARIGICDVQVFGELDGAALVSYQAVVRREDWDRVWPVLAPNFLLQRTAYRRQYGGSQAPEISAKVPPRFQESPYKSSADTVAMKVRGTFLHFDGAASSSHSSDEEDDAPAARPLDDLDALLHGVAVC